MEEKKVVVVPLWSHLFGHLRIWNQEFNEDNYPLEPEIDGAAWEYGFGETVSGIDAANHLKERGCSLPGLRAYGQYILTHPWAMFKHPLVCIGAEWQESPSGNIYIPGFAWRVGEPSVKLYSRNTMFLSDCRFLVYWKLGQKWPKIE